jgi:alkyl hydroperoxide reductase subunit AhpC
MATLRLGDIAPDFTQDSTDGQIRFHQWLGDSWGVLFSHPKDFTPVCTTELGYTAKLKGEFDKRNVKVLAVSVDPVESHKGWVGDIEETQNCKVNFPILADPDRKVASLYDMIHPNANDTLTVRSVYIIDPKKKIRLTITYPASTAQLRRDPARDRFPPAHRQAQRRHARELEAGRGRDHRALGHRPRGDQAEIPQGLPRAEALPALHAAARPLKPGEGDRPSLGKVAA